MLANGFGCLLSQGEEEFRESLSCVACCQARESLMRGLADWEAAAIRSHRIPIRREAGWRGIVVVSPNSQRVSWSFQALSTVMSVSCGVPRLAAPIHVNKPAQKEGGAVQ